MEFIVSLLEVQLEFGNLVGGSISRPEKLLLLPGQYLLAHAPLLAEPIPIALFPSGIDEQTICLAPSLPPSWLPGITLKIRGPLGKGFSLPPLAHRVALAGLDRHPLRLLPLLTEVMRTGREAVLVSSAVPEGLPPQVEVLGLGQLAEAAAWADFLALDVPVQALAELPGALGLRPHQPLPASAQVLVVTPMPCGGLANCMVCAVRTRRGWKLACQDGPVFPLADLELI